MIEGYWTWFRAKSDRKTGYKLLLTRWVLFDLLVSMALSFGLEMDGFAFAQKALFPAASILAGMAFAWTARASTILSNQDFRDKVMSPYNPLADYVYGFQMSIMVLFACVIYIAIMAAGGFQFYIISPIISQGASSIGMYVLISMTIRECWGVINFTNLLTLLDDIAKKR